MDLKSFLLNSGISMEHVTIDFLVDPKFLWMGLGVILLLFTIISLILVYHWIVYGYKPMKIVLMGTVYVCVSLVIFSIILITLLEYSTAI